MRRFIVPILVAIAVALPMVLANLGGSTAAAQRGNAVPGKYIVTLKPNEQPGAVSSRLTVQASLNVEHLYQHALIGFSAVIPDNQLDKVRNDPAVLSVMEDRVVTIQNDTSPTGIRRSEADRNALSQIGTHTNPINVDVAVIDTGIDGDHPDLNVAGGVNCVPGESSWEDLNGHGTHVAGTIGALDNESGVVGVAPGARLWAVRVLNANGEGEFSDVICGIDWVTANAATINVANMSLGGEGTATGCANGGFHQAVCESVNAGVTYVVAAGNSSVDANSFVPASFPEVITVSALADTDGQPGGNGPSSIYYGADDTLATFSNYGSAVDIAAPGVNILSTWLHGSHNTISGTSMASPHVAGAAAIYLYQNPGASPTATRSHILAEAWPQSSPEGFTGDPDGFAEPLLNAGTIGGLEPLPPPPPPEAGCSLTSDSGIVGSTTTMNCAGFQAGEWVWIYWDAVGDNTRGIFVASGSGDGSVSITIPDASFGEHQIIAHGSTSGIQSILPFMVEPSVELSKSSGPVGTFLIVYLKGFGAEEPVDVRWYSDRDTFTVITTETTSTTGRAYAFISIPDGVGATYTIEAVGSDTGAVSSGEFTVLPGLKLSPPSGRVGSNVTVNLSGFQHGESVDVRWTGISVGQATADDLGRGSIQLVVPESPNGANLVEGIGSAGSQASASYNVYPSIALSSTSGVVGTQVNLTLTGYGTGETVRVDWYETSSSSSTLLTLQTSALGSASTTFTVPEAVSGYHRVEAIGESSGKKSTSSFSIVSQILLSDYSGFHGETITATMTGYKAQETVHVKWYEVPYSGDIIATTTSSTLGSATVTFEVPADTSFGEHKVESVSDAGLGRASTIFTVESIDGPVEATCAVDPESGIVGSKVTVDCYGFEPGEYVRLYWDTTSSTQKGSFKVANGSGSGTMTIPDAAGGEHTIIGVGTSSGSQAETPFTVLPGISLSKTSGAVGSYISATVRGYAAGETVNLIWHDGASSTVIKAGTASSTGRAFISFAVPEASGGTYTIEAVGLSSNSSSTAEFTVTIGVKLSPTVGKVGASLTVTVSGFEAGETVDISWDGQTMGTVTASQSGSASLSTTVPETTGGSHTVSAMGANSGSISASYRVLPSIALSETSGPVGTAVTVEVTGFGTGETVRVDWFDTSTSSTTVGTVTTTANGSATLSFVTPDASYGLHWVEATGLDSQLKVKTSFVTTAAVSLSVSEGPVGTSVTVTLTGFRASETINLRWYMSAFSSYQIATGQADAFGNATITFVVPEDAMTGDHKVEGRSAAGYPSAQALFTVT
ncbi:hypothetical protein BH23CHL2_BH23CHL2_09120 [soil metagenome]